MWFFDDRRIYSWEFKAMRFRQIKSQVTDMLLDSPRPDFSALPPGKATRALLGLLGSSRPQVKWRAVMALGRVTADRAEGNLEPGREVMRRLVWGMNDESGTAGFGMAEGMGAILAAHPGLRSEFINLLISYLKPHYLNLVHPGIQHGIIWGLGWVAQADFQALRQGKVKEAALPLLGRKDRQLKGLCAWLLGGLGDADACAALRPLLGEPGPVILFDGREIVESSLERITRESLIKLGCI
jgi:hypothetical protein